MPIVSMKALLESGVHFGHRTQRWNPKMRPFIFTERNGIHIIDLQQTIPLLDRAYIAVRDVVSEGRVVLFVGTKKQAQDTIATEATRCGMPYVNNRWLGGTLTNFRTIKQRIDYMINLEERRERGEFDLLIKKEALGLNREIEKLESKLGGIRTMKQLPDMVFIVDTRREHLAVHEAQILEIPTVAMIDSNSDPDLIDYIIPANDDAIRAIKLITEKIADAVLEGQQMREAFLAEEENLETSEAAYDEYALRAREIEEREGKLEDETYYEEEDEDYIEVRDSYEEDEEVAEEEDENYEADYEEEEVEDHEEENDDEETA